MVHHRVEHVSVSALADRGPGSVSAHGSALSIKRGICDWLRPEMLFLGDFHTHPYTSLAEVNGAKGWRFSDVDELSFLLDDDYWRENPNPLMAVVAIAPLKRVHWTQPVHQKSNVWRFDVFDHRFWLGVAVGEGEGRHRTVTSSARSPVHLTPPPVDVSNWSQYRLGEDA